MKEKKCDLQLLPLPLSLSWQDQAIFWELERSTHWSMQRHCYGQRNQPCPDKYLRGSLCTSVKKKKQQQKWQLNFFTSKMKKCSLLPFAVLDTSAVSPCWRWAEEACWPPPASRSMPSSARDIPPWSVRRCDVYPPPGKDPCRSLPCRWSWCRLFQPGTACWCQSRKVASKFCERTNNFSHYCLCLPIMT